MHSANWDQEYDFKGKRLAVIGAGSSGVQIVASLYDEVDHLYTWVRSPTWITAGFAQDFAADDGKNFECTSQSNLHLVLTEANSRQTAMSKENF
jgi:cation diffusion facilitator CzcD-associated flavoprotein CzcO